MSGVVALVFTGEAAAQEEPERCYAVVCVGKVCIWEEIDCPPREHEPAPGT